MKTATKWKTYESGKTWSCDKGTIRLQIVLGSCDENRNTMSKEPSYLATHHTGRSLGAYGNLATAKSVIERST